MQLVAIVRTRVGGFATLKLVDGRLFGGMPLPQIAGTTVSISDIIGVVAFGADSLRSLESSLSLTEGLSDALWGVFYHATLPPEKRVVDFFSYLALPFFVLDHAATDADVVARAIEKTERMVRDPMREISDALNYDDIVHIWAQRGG
jgi:hypothetical protein